MTAFQLYAAYGAPVLLFIVCLGLVRFLRWRRACRESAQERKSQSDISAPAEPADIAMLEASLRKRLSELQKFDTETSSLQRNGEVIFVQRGHRPVSAMPRMRRRTQRKTSKLAAFQTD